MPGEWLIGWPIGQAIGGGKEINWTLVLTGTMLGGIGIYFEHQANTHYQNAIEIYNSK